MSGVDYVNYMHIAELEQGNRNQEQLADLQSRAQSIAQATGMQPANWYEFKRTHPAEDKTSIGGALLGALAGGVIGVALGAMVAPLISVSVLTAAVALGAIGAAGLGYAGYEYDSPNSKRERQLKAYEGYLDAAEAQGRGRGMALTMESAGLPTRDDHARSLQTAQGAALAR